MRRCKSVCIKHAKECSFVVALEPRPEAGLFEPFDKIDRHRSDQK